MKKFNFKLKVYYEDTDAQGIVYYANYLKFFDRARSEAIASYGLSNKYLKEKYKVIIIVKSCNINYKKSAKLEDCLNISSKVSNMTYSSFIMKQVAKRGKDIISEADVHLVVVDMEGKPTKIPDVLKKKLEN
tara:strand:+ start:144 stop:539 length:396 start_codon:yes stop_codon:yes gene_type:complete